MSLVGCFVAPHPPIAVPEVGGEEVRRVESTLQAMRRMGRRVAHMVPQTIVFLSPHSPLTRSHMGVSLASSYQGSLAFFRAPQIRLQASSDQALAQTIIDEVAAAGIPVLATAASGETVDLDHGAVVPLHFMTERLGYPFRLVSLSFSYLSLDEHVGFGEAVGRVLVASPTKTIYLASSDLSHRLTRDAPAGYDPRGAEFDRAVADSFAAGDWQALLTIDPTTVKAAGECGYRSLAVLSGLVNVVNRAGTTTQTELYSYEGPFGVGYLVGEVKLLPGTTASDRRREKEAFS
jgi:aromatic ring-opening dioxygenase LigB subunit